MVPSKFRSRVKPAAFERVNPGSTYTPFRDGLLCSIVTFTCPFAGRTPDKTNATRVERKIANFTVKSVDPGCSSGAEVSVTGVGTSIANRVSSNNLGYAGGIEIART